MAKLKSEPTQLELIAAVSPKYAALLSKASELNSRYEEIIEEANGPRGRVDGTVSVTTGDVTYHPVPLAEQFRRSLISWVSQLPKAKPKPVVRNAAAVALIGNDLLSPQPIEEINPQAPQPSWSGQDRLAALGAESETIADALRLIAPEISAARREYSRLVAAQRGSEYDEIVGRVTDAAKAFAETLLEHHRFINTMRECGVAYSAYRPLNLLAFGNINEPNTPIMAVLTDAAEKGHISPELPQFKMPIDISYLQNGD